MDLCERAPSAALCTAETLSDLPNRVGLSSACFSISTTSCVGKLREIHISVLDGLPPLCQILVHQRAELQQHNSSVELQWP